MPTVSSWRTLFQCCLVVALLTAAVGPAVSMVATQQEYAVADHREGRIDPGREDDEDQQFPINLTFFPVDHSPGVTGGSFEVYASGLSEDITGHWIVLETGDFDVGTCQATDASAFGIDRGNDGTGTATDESLLTAYKSYTSTDEGFFIEFYKESALAGEPVVATTADQVVARQNNCVDNPTEPGWYRVTGLINGSTKDDTQTDYTIYATSRYTYVCDCESRAEAEQQLGPPPNEGGEASASTATPSATPTPDATATPAPRSTDTATATASREPATATADGRRQQADATTATDTGTVTPTPTATAGSQATARPEQSATTAAAGSRATPTTPTLADGPGFGGGLALLALLSAALVLSRNRI